ncbi:lyase family protein [Georgenia sp. SUBG003]|uniref:lyase family protein n=1 Tax=Georgenia sp. SUBG003 TaxID=1497974 RepID=UPI003AB432B7
MSSALRELVVALAEVKQAAARTNRALGLLEEEVADAISAACAEIVGGSWHDHFVVDCVQGGAGTSTNMNANEVVANRALELLGHPRGAYSVVHPLDSVNKSQSTNDVYPTALRLAAHRAVGRLIEALRHLQGAFTGKATEFTDVVTIGRTQLQDAVPVSLGHVFAAYAVTLGEDCDRLTEESSAAQRRPWHRGFVGPAGIGGTARAEQRDAGRDGGGSADHAGGLHLRSFRESKKGLPSSEPQGGGSEEGVLSPEVLEEGSPRGWGSPRGAPCSSLLQRR